MPTSSWQPSAGQAKPGPPPGRARLAPLRRAGSGTLSKAANRDAGRILQATGPGGVQTNDPAKTYWRKLTANMCPGSSSCKTNGCQEKVESGNPATREQIEREQMLMRVAQERINAASYNLVDYEHLLFRVVVGTLVIGALFLGLLMLYVGMRRLSRGRSAGAFFLVGSLVLVFLFMGSLAGTFFLIGGRGTHQFEARKIETKTTAMVKPMAAPTMAPMMDGQAEALGAPLADEELRLQEGAPNLGEDGEAKLKGAPNFRRAPLAVAERDRPVVGDVIALMPPQRVLQGRALEPGLDEGDRKMRQAGNYQDLLRRRLNRIVNVPSGTDPFPVRIYAHVRQPHRKGSALISPDFLLEPALVLPGARRKSPSISPTPPRAFQVLVSATPWTAGSVPPPWRWPRACRSASSPRFPSR